MNIYFILSAPRSGSTLLRLHLNEFESVIALPETHFFVFMQQNSGYNLNQLKDRSELADKWINYHSIKKFPIDHQKLKNRIVQEVKNWKDLFLVTLDQFRLQSYPQVIKPIWVEKSPPHIFYQKEIRNIFPESKFIYLVRDPRAVIGSLKTMPWSTSNVYVLARSWSKSTRLMELNSQSTVVKYESLVAEPEAEMKKIFDFMQISGDFKLATAVGDKAERHNWNSSESFKPISTDRILKWKKQLSNVDYDVAVIEHVCKDSMRQYNYEFMGLKKNKAFYLNYFGSIVKYILIRLF